jgi:hypothetical protein
VDRVVVVDIRNFPTLTFIPLDTRWLLQQAHKGAISTRPLLPAKFYELLKEDFLIQEKPFDLAVARAVSPPTTPGVGPLNQNNGIPTN